MIFRPVSGQWCCTDDLMVTKVSLFEATHQQPYLLFYQKAQKLPCPFRKCKRSLLSLKKGSCTPDPSTEQQKILGEKQKNGTNNLKRGSSFVQPKDLSKSPKMESKVVPTSSITRT